MLKIGIVFGGLSAEHEVSLASTRSVMEAFKTLTKYEPVLLGLDKKGQWITGPHTHDYLVEKADQNMLFIKPRNKAEDYEVHDTPPHDIIEKCDYILPLTHGTVGEDGKLQGFFETLGKPIIGCSVLSSAVCFDKQYVKTVIEGHGYPVTPGLTIDLLHEEITEEMYNEICKELDSDKLVVKPNDNGSGIGISKVDTYEQFVEGIAEAANFTNTALVEKYIQHQEIVVGVLGTGNNIIISDLGESNATIDTVYKYEDKYNENTFCKCPADLDPEMEKKIKDYTAEIYNLVGCTGWSRIDFFIEQGTNNLYMNEINTIPGLSKHSVFPKIFEPQGLSYEDVIQKILDASIEGIKREEEGADIAA